MSLSGITNSPMFQVFRDIARIDRVLDELIRSGPQRIHRGLVTTTDATATTIFTFATKTDAAYIFTAEIVGRSTGGAVGAYKRTFYAKNIGAALTLGAAQDDFTFEDTAAWAVSFATSGTDILFKVTGAAATTIDWALRFRAESQPADISR